MFYNFIKLQFIMGKISKEEVLAFSPMFISEEQANEIIAEQKGV